MPDPDSQPPSEPVSKRSWRLFSHKLFVKNLCRAGLLALLLFCAGMGAVMHMPGPNKETQEVLIPKGASLSKIATILYKAKIIHDPIVFKLIAYAGGPDQLKAGEYEFPPHRSMSHVLKQLHEGLVIVRRFVLPEGLTSYEAVALLRDTSKLSGTIETIPPEGSLFPSTYHYTRDDPREGMLQRMLQKQRDFIDEAWAKRDKDLPLHTKEEALVMASIIEKETGIKASERARVAGVFYNRLRKGMRLQSDPTTIYALTKGEGQLDRPLYRKDLKIESPYNTYHVYGLPPGPICNPGQAAIQAALHPEKHHYLYFVADGTGGHLFASTLAEHNRNVVRWNKIRREN